MNILQIKDMVENGKSVIIEFNKNIYKFNEDKFDPKMRAEIISVQDPEDDFYYPVVVNAKEFEVENRKVALYDWLDSKGDPVLCWMDTSHYPQDGIEIIYVEKNNLPFKVIHNESHQLFKKYKESKFNGTYVEWLESSLIKKMGMREFTYEECISKIKRFNSIEKT